MCGVVGVAGIDNVDYNAIAIVNVSNIPVVIV